MRYHANGFEGIRLVLFLFSLIPLCSKGNSGVQSPQIHQYGLFETFVPNQQMYADPYRDTILEVTFRAPDGTLFKHWGFYDGENKWGIRFRPEIPGEWSFEAAFTDGQTVTSGRFTCMEKNATPPIHVSKDNPVWFTRGNTPFPVRALHIGDRFFAENWPQEERTRFLDWVQGQGYNMLSIASHYLNRDEEGRGKGWNTPRLWPLDAGEFRKMEDILDDLQQRGIAVFPFAGFFGRSADFPTDPVDRELYVRYVMARIGHYGNLFYNVAGPEPNLKGKPFLSVEDVNRLGCLIRKLDIYDHPLTVHCPTGPDLYRDSDWSTFGTVQGPKTLDRIKLNERLLESHHPAKPLFAQETLWSGNQFHQKQTGGGYSDDDLRKNAYVIKMSGAGLCFADNNGNSSSGFSGTLDLNERKQHRHDIIRMVWDFFDTIPWSEMRPTQGLIDSGYCLAQPGKQYLVYLEESKPVSVNLAAGSYQVEWINASKPHERLKQGTTADGQNLAPPPLGDDWLLYLRREDKEIRNDLSGTHNNAKLLFKSGFEGKVFIEDGKWSNPQLNRHQILGLDSQTQFDWRKDWEPYLDEAFFQYVIAKDSKADTFVTTRIIEMPGPNDSSEDNRVLYMGMKGDDPLNGSTTRNELDLHPKETFQQAYSKYWMKIHPDFMERLPEKTWVMVMEWKEPNNPLVQTGGTNNWRTNITIRQTGEDKLAWYFQRQTVQPERITEQMIWNESVPMPVGEWFQVESFWKWGKNGRIWFAINGETVFDQYGRFEHPDNPLGLQFWAIFKNYRGQEWYDDDLSNGDETWFVYDDVEVWSGFPPGHPQPKLDKDIILKETFDSGFPDDGLPGNWWFEGGESGASASISMGRLLVDADNQKGQAGTVWLDQPLSGDLEVEFDVRVKSAIEDSNNVNFFMYFRDPSHGSLRASKSERESGSYRLYTRDRLTGLVMTHVANGDPANARTRLREVPPFDPPLAEFFGTTLAAGENYHVRIRIVDGTIQYYKNGCLLLEGKIKDFDHNIPGYLGFRTWQTELTWDNLIVRRP